MRWRWVRPVLLTLALLLVLLAGGVWLLLQSIDRGAVMSRAVQEVKNATGRDFAVEGPVRISLWPRLALVAEGVRLGNAPWGSRADMAQLRFDIALAPLLERRVEIGSIEVRGADLLLETNADGQGNWNFSRADAASPSPEAKAASPIRVTLEQFGVQNSTLRWRSGRNGHTETLDIAALQMERRAGAGRATPNAWQVETDATWNAQKLHAEGAIGIESNEQTGARALTPDLDLRIEGATGSVEGRIGLGEAAGQAQLKVKADIQAVQPLNQLLRANLPIPVPAKLAGDLAWQPRQLTVDNFEFESQGQAVAGRITWDRGAAPPLLRLDLHADNLDLARLYPTQRAASAATDGKGDARVFPDTPFPALKLPRLAIQADLRSERLVLPGGLELGAVQLRGSTRSDRIDITQLDFGLARGRFNVVGGWQQPEGAGSPRVNAQIKARGVAMDALLALARREAVISGGRTEIDARLSASGNSPRKVAQSLNGELRMRMGEASSTLKRSSGSSSVLGELVSALLRAFTPLRSADDSFRLQCAAARLPVKDGRITVDRSVAIEGDRVDVVMSGLIDLASERVELGMRPTVKKGTGLDPSAFAGVVKIAGPLAAPKVEVSLAGTARQAIDIGAAVATGGITIVGERLLGKVNDAHPCDSAYSGSAKTTTAGDSKGSAPSNKKDGMSRPLRGLFER